MATTRSRRGSWPLQRSCFSNFPCWSESAIARLGDQHKNSCREMEIYASLSLALIDLAAAYPLKPYRAVATGLRGQWLLLQNDLREGIPLLKRALEERHAQRHEMPNMRFLCELLIGVGSRRRLASQAFDLPK